MVALARLGRLALCNVIDRLTAEKNDMVAAARELPASGYALEVDGRLKAEFETKDGARAGAQELKRRFPMLQVRIYDAQTQAREEIQLSQLRSACSSF
jgi:hypothetical protein